MDYNVHCGTIIGGHINLGNAKAVMAQLHNSIKTHSFDFISLNEPYHLDNRIINIPINYSIVQSQDSPKAAIVIKANYNSQLIYANEELVIIMSQFHHQNTIIASIYCPPSNNIDNNLDVLKNFIIKYANLPFIILGDFNAKSRIWGQRDLDERGSKLLSFCHQMDINIENGPNTPPTYSSSRGDSWVDLLITKNINDNINMIVSAEITNSDHNMLFVHYDPPGSMSPNTSKVLLWSIDWLKIKVRIANIIGGNLILDNLTTNELNTKLNSIQELIFQAASKKPANQLNSNSKKKSSFSWTRELQIKRSKTRALRRLFQKEKDPNFRQIKKLQFKHCQASYKKLILITKRSKFKEFINSITNNSLFGNNLKIISSKKKRCPIRKPIINAQGIPSKTIDESNSELLNYHFPWFNNISNSIGIYSQDDFNQFTMQEIEAIILSIKPNKAVGVDGLPGELIKEIFFANKKWFVELFNILVGRGIFPVLWKIARVVLIGKEGKNLDHPSHFRPICILPCWGKILDKLISD
ncbi:uncharacterized protein CDAR_394471 [Caerostris darwini]|uniref:Endonuclease/exonuclease/phosphatase domain-containing protein n=1 Tax=Caerostris darwini TaxID=1538125 RepID=A0AAV4MD02_9ARAC|nr:uncharacterized protein CDAR_394471 [Caerostris darwini]